VVIAPDCDLEIDPLGETSLSQLTLQGLMTGTPVPRAMFTAPSQPQAVFVTEGAKVGPRCGYRLIDIRDNEVVFEELTSVEEVRTQTVLTLNANRIDEAEFTNR
jgi:Tfp pilus assembly protein PilP